MRILALISLSLLSILGALAQEEQCGWQADGKLCPLDLCCSYWGFCGSTEDYCCGGCQSNCNPEECSDPQRSPSGSSDVSSLISKALFEKLLPNRNDPASEGNRFYTYEAFIAVAKEFGGFGTTGNNDTKKREIVAFLAQTSHETTGIFFSFPSKRFITTGYYLTGLIIKYNYGPAGIAMGSDKLANPDLVAADATISFRVALWFWMTPQSPKPSCHDVITGRWIPSAADSAAGRVPGYGVITNIINGGLECGQGFSTAQQGSRIGFLKHFSDIVGVDYGENLDCNNQRPFE
ncbi:hypothetical protein RHSIM_Rhsim10G0200600 [Rhododendron simsii]|uniref:Chitin-binding type-1 domain-containing protein n=1 Tax=Rhododendron simsii TaxID=118357 RepID=A0A834GDA2_RHOSS|nr:hypothetical protein RHSIM_Rhsim10G0200600 [Rhododendron simsii]